MAIKNSLSSALGCQSRRRAALVVMEENIFRQGSSGAGRVRPAPVLTFRPSGRGRCPAMPKREAYELLLIEEADAWFEYLETTRAQSVLRYTEVEPWAWAR